MSTTQNTDRVDAEQALQTLHGGIAALARADSLSAHARTVAEMMGALRRIGRAATAQKGGKAAVLDYLIENLGQPVAAEEVAAVSGVGEYARRVRELRAEGWRIMGGTRVPNKVEARMMRKLGLDAVPAKSYCLISDTPLRRRRAAR